MSMSHEIENNRHYILDVNQTYRLFLWTPWDRRFNIRLDDDMVNELDNELNCLKDSFKEKCYIAPKADLSKELGHTESFTRLYNSILPRPILIMGFSGVGKTTFLNVHLNDVCDDYTLIDIGKEYLLKDEAHIKDWLEKFHRNSTHMSIPPAHFSLLKQTIVQLLNTLYDLLGISYGIINYNDTYGNIPEDVPLKEYLPRIANNIRTQFANKSGPILDIGKIINDFTKSSSSMLIRGHRFDATENDAYTTKIIECLFSKMLHVAGGDKHRYELTDGISVIKLLFGLLSNLIACQKGVTPNSGFKHAIAFDNIEHFIDRGALFDNEIVELYKCIADYMKEQNRPNNDYAFLSKNSSNFYTMHFKIVFVCREVSALMTNEEIKSGERPDQFMPYDMNDDEYDVYIQSHRQRELGQLEYGDVDQQDIVLRGNIDFHDILVRKRQFYMNHFGCR